MREETIEVKIARLEESMSATRGELRAYHGDVKRAMERIDKHHDSITILKRDRWWISGLAGVVFSWLGLKLFGKGG